MTNKSPTTVLMPTDQALQPAHVVAIRPGIDGDRVSRGDYVLTVETASGSRNVVASEDGVVRVAVSLMQDVAPGTPLFMIEAEEPSAEPADSGSIPEQATEPDRESSWTELLFAVFCLALAIVWPGFLFIAADSIGLGGRFAVVAAMLIAAFVLPIWILNKIPALRGNFEGNEIISGSLGLLLIAIGAGATIDDVRAWQSRTAMPVAESFVARFAPGDPAEPNTVETAIEPATGAEPQPSAEQTAEPTVIEAQQEPEPATGLSPEMREIIEQMSGESPDERDLRQSVNANSRTGDEPAVNHGNCAAFLEFGRSSGLIDEERSNWLRIGNEEAFKASLAEAGITDSADIGRTLEAEMQYAGSVLNRLNRPDALEPGSVAYSVFGPLPDFLNRCVAMSEDTAGYKEIVDNVRALDDYRPPEYDCASSRSASRYDDFDTTDALVRHNSRVVDCLSDAFDEEHASVVVLVESIGGSYADNRYTHDTLYSSRLRPIIEAMDERRTVLDQRMEAANDASEEAILLCVQKDECEYAR